jgi:hypothetical protein
LQLGLCKERFVQNFANGEAVAILETIKSLLNQQLAVGARIAFLMANGENQLLDSTPSGSWAEASGEQDPPPRAVRFGIGGFDGRDQAIKC